HGRPVQVATADGGEVQVRGRETTVRRKSGRTAVSVFDGDARVTSAAEAVEVPARHGTTFFDHAPPWRPKPLPAAPDWVGGAQRVVTATHLQHASTPRGGNASLSWNGVKGVAGYRIELGRDPTFRQILMREEVPHS